MIDITIEQRDLEVTLRGLREGLADLRPAWGDVHTILVDLIKVHFQSEGGYSGNRWVPLSPAYAAWKRRNYGSKSILRLRDRLYGSLVSTSDGEHVWRTGPSFAEYGTRVPYAKVHQYGYAPKNIPKRVVLPGLTKVEGERVVDAILAHVFSRMSGAARRSK